MYLLTKQPIINFNVIMYVIVLSIFNCFGQESDNLTFHQFISYFGGYSLISTQHICKIKNNNVKNHCLNADKTFF